MSEAIITCAGCARVLLEKTVLGHMTTSDGPVQFSDYRFRPWIAVVVSRTRLVDMPPSYENPELEVSTVPDGSLPNGRTIEIRETPMVCSRPCLASVAATWTHRTHSVIAMVNPPTIKEGEDYLSHLLGSSGPLPDAPSDEWWNLGADGTRVRWEAP